MDQEAQMIDTLSETIDAFFEEVDPEDFETEDLAYTILRALKGANRLS